VIIYGMEETLQANQQIRGLRDVAVSQNPEGMTYDGQTNKKRSSKTCQQTTWTVWID